MDRLFKDPIFLGAKHPFNFPCRGRQRTSNIGVLPLSFLPLSPLSLFPLCPSHPPLIQLRGLGERSPTTKRILVHFEVKVKHFRVLISCYCAAIDLFYDGTNHIINYVDEISALNAWMCRSYWVSNTLMDPNTGGPDPCDPCGVGAYAGDRRRCRSLWR